MKAPQNISYRISALLLGLLLAGCVTTGHNSSNHLPSDPELDFRIYKMPDLSEMPGTLKNQPPFTCTFEKDRVPPPNPEADMLFNHAKWLMQTNRHLEDAKDELEKELREVRRLYRIAAAWGHSEAATELVYLLASSYGNDINPFDIAKDLIIQEIPRGYYLMGYLLRDRNNDRENPAALQYIRKAADLGDIKAQYYLANSIVSGCSCGSEQNSYETGKQMRRCVADQGHAEAAFSTAVSFEYDKEYTEALKYFQMALKAGSRKAADQLQYIFSGYYCSDSSQSEKCYTGLDIDEERAARYGRVDKILRNYQYGFDVSIDELDEIVPLPPARLPDWNGQIEWVKKRKKNEQPPLPSEERIKEMALAKGLDPETALALPIELEKAPAFTCTHEKERATPYDPDADMLYRRAVWLSKKAQRRQDQWNTEESATHATEIERLYRIATAWGHDKAASDLALRLLSIRVHPGSGDFITKPVEIAEELISRGIPRGYFLMGLMLSNSLGVKHDSRGAFRYLRKAAALGDPKAQNFLGDPENEIGAEMLRCAADQGHIKAAVSMAKMWRWKNDGEVLRYFQIAVKAGDVEAAKELSSIFRYLTPDDDDPSDVDQAENIERAVRYEKISNVLSDGIGGKVDEIDQIVPLPPAKLPKWDGRIRSLKKWEKHVAPQLPSEERIKEMALTKGLDPETGWPLKK